MYNNNQNNFNQQGMPQQQPQQFAPAFQQQAMPQQGFAAPQGQQQFAQPQAQQFAQPQGQQFTAPNAFQGNGGGNAQNAQAGEKVYYSAGNILFNPANNGNLSDAIWVVSGTLMGATKLMGKPDQNGQSKPYVAVRMMATLGDKFVAKNFGNAAVARDHQVNINFSLNGFQAENFMSYPPFFSQTAVAVLHHVKVDTFTTKNGNTGHSIGAYCAGLFFVGSKTKRDGTVSKRLEIVDKTQGQGMPQTQGMPQNGYTPAPQGQGGYAPAPQQAMPQQGFAAPQGMPQQQFAPAFQQFAQPQQGMPQGMPQGQQQFAQPQPGQMWEDYDAEDGELPF